MTEGFMRLPADLRRGSSACSNALQPLMLLLSSSFCAQPDTLTLGHATLTRTMLRLAALAAALDLRLVLSGLQGTARLIDEAELLQVAPTANVMARATPDAFQAPALLKVIDLTPGRALVLCGAATEVEIQLTALTARRRNIEVHVLVDAVGGIDARSEAAAFQTMASHGVRLSSTHTLLAQLLCDVTTPQALAVTALMAAHAPDRPLRGPARTVSTDARS